MGSLIDCLREFGKDLSPYYKNKIMERYKGNLRGKFIPVMAGKNALLDTIDELETEHTTIFNKAQRLVAKPEEKTPSGQASVGKYAKTKMEAVDVSEYGRFKDVDVSIDAIRGKTGEKVTVRYNAKKALEKIDSDIELLNKIVECL